VPALLHQIQCVYHCAVPNATDTICVSMWGHYCKRYNVCITVQSILHQIQCVYHCKIFNVPDKMQLCALSIAPGTMCVKMCCPYCTRQNLCTTVLFLLHQTKCVGHCAITNVPDTMFVSLWNPYCTRQNMRVTMLSLMYQINFVCHCGFAIAKDKMWVSLCRQ